MANLARRMALKRLGMGAAVAPMMPAMVARGIGEGGGMLPAAGGVMAATGTVAYEPWSLAGMAKRAWQELDRERDLRNWRRRCYRDAMLGVIEGDIAALGSLSHAAKARMQTARMARQEREDNLERRRLYPDPLETP